jgi:hypothetical protein
MRCVVVSHVDMMNTKIEGRDGESSLYLDLLKEVCRLGHIPNPGMNPAKYPAWLTFAEQYPTPIDDQGDYYGYPRVSKLRSESSGIRGGSG